MDLTKYRHSCVRIDDGDRSLVIDPGAFSDIDAALDGAEAILITHEHADHLDVERVRQALQSDPRLQLWAPQGVAETLAELGEQVVAVAPDESFEAAGFAVRTFGGQHAVIHPLVPVIANVGYLVDGTVYHPGDSFIVPPAPVSTLLLPVVAPWSKVSEVIDFALAVRAPTAYPIHDAIVNDLYSGLLGNTLVPIAGRYGVDVRPFDGTIHA